MKYFQKIAKVHGKSWGPCPPAPQFRRPYHVNVDAGMECVDNLESDDAIAMKICPTLDDDQTDEVGDANMQSDGEDPITVPTSKEVLNMIEKLKMHMLATGLKCESECLQAMEE